MSLLGVFTGLGMASDRVSRILLVPWSSGAVQGWRREVRLGSGHPLAELLDFERVA